MSRARTTPHPSDFVGSFGVARLSAVFCLGALILALTACGGPEPAPVAELEVSTDQLELPYPEWRSLRLAWTPSTPLEPKGAPRVFLHLLDSSQRLVRTFDHPFPQSWEPGEQVAYDVRIYQSALGPPLEPGTYRLTAGLYSDGGERFPLVVTGRPEARVGRAEYEIAQVVVPELGADAPGFAFADAWDELETGVDSQVLGRRWLEGDGVIRVLNLEVPGSVWLRLDIPRQDGPQGRSLAPRNPGQAPTLEITSTCSGVSRVLEVPGVREEILPVYPGEGTAECEILLTANYRLVDPKTRRTDVAALEIIAFTPAEL